MSDSTDPDDNIPLLKRIQHVLNSVSAENVSNTPDFILAAFLTNCLAAFNHAVTARESWYGRDPAIGPGQMVTEGHTRSSLHILSQTSSVEKTDPETD